MTYADHIALRSLRALSPRIAAATRASDAGAARSLAAEALAIHDAHPAIHERVGVSTLTDMLLGREPAFSAA